MSINSTQYVLVEGVDRLIGWLFEWQLFCKQVEAGALNYNFAEIILQRCIEEAPEKTGRLKASHSIKAVTPELIAIMNSAPYAIFVHDGFIHWISKQLVPGNPWMIRGINNAIDDMRKVTYESVAMRQVPERRAFSGLNKAVSYSMYQRTPPPKQSWWRRIIGWMRRRFGGGS